MEISNADRDKTCAVTFKANAARAGYKLELDPACATVFAFVKDVEGWTLSNDTIRLIDARGKAVFEFTEVESGMYEAERAERGLISYRTRPPRPPFVRPSRWRANGL